MFDIADRRGDANQNLREGPLLPVRVAVVKRTRDSGVTRTEKRGPVRRRRFCVEWHGRGRGFRPQGRGLLRRSLQMTEWRLRPKLQRETPLRDPTSHPGGLLCAGRALL